MLKRILIIWMATIFVVWPANLSAQQQPGRMKGRVVDESGNPAANVDVTVRSVDTGTENTVQTGGPGTFSTDRPKFRLGDTRNFDVALVKRFEVPEHLKVEIRGDAYNIFNRRQVTGLPVSTLGSGIGFAPTSNFVLLSNPQFNDIRGTVASNPRTFQFALRVIF